MPQTTVFTLCSNNYLAQAKTLGHSVKEHNPDFHFVIGLVDALHPEIDYSLFRDFEVIPFYELGYTEFEIMLSKYNIIEFNTSVKPFYFEFLFKRMDYGGIIYYVDPDIQFFSNLYEANHLLNNYDILITPHITQPSIEIRPFETIFLNVGIYNLGFLGLRKSARTMYFLDWFKERLRRLCFNDTSKGLFVDQLWINFVAVLFDGVHILKSPGYNMACWNFEERKILQFNGEYYVNDLNTKLVFFHFSGFKPSEMNFVCKVRQEGYTLQERNDLAPLFEGYARHLHLNNYSQFSSFKPLLGFAQKKYTTKQRIGLALKRRVSKYIKSYFEV